MADSGLTRLQLGRGAIVGALATSQATAETIATTSLWLFGTDITPVRVDALVAADAISQAEHLVAEFAGWAAKRAVPAANAAVATCRASLAAGRGNLDDAAGLYEQAARAWAELPRPYAELLATERHGRCLFDIGAHDAAAQTLTETQRRLHRLGARWDADRVACLLREHGVEAARAWRGGRRGYGDQLSPRELDVARLVAEGMTNREVRERLFLSPKTVDKHLHGAMRKLGIHSRTVLATLVASDRLPTGGSRGPAD